MNIIWRIKYMNKKHSYNKMVILGVIFSLLLVQSFINIGFCAFSKYPQTLDMTLDEEDGFLEINKFRKVS